MTDEKMQINEIVVKSKQNRSVKKLRGNCPRDVRKAAEKRIMNDYHHNSSNGKAIRHLCRDEHQPMGLNGKKMSSDKKEEERKRDY